MTIAYGIERCNEPCFGAARWCACEVTKLAEKFSHSKEETFMSNSNASATARHDTDDLRSMAHDVKAAAQEKMGAAAQKVQQMGSDVKHAVQDRFEGLQSHASDYYGQGRAKVRELNHKLESRVRAQPMTSLLVAGSVGFALGFLLTRR
jgi:ElaB/YqjD/DUF883 family membrane-anchored ribosome-binding protein